MVVGPWFLIRICVCDLLEDLFLIISEFFLTAHVAAGILYVTPEKHLETLVLSVICTMLDEEADDPPVVENYDLCLCIDGGSVPE